SATTTFSSATWTNFAGILNIGAGAAAGAGKARIDVALPATAAVNVLANGTLYVATGVTDAASLTLNGGATGESFGQLRLEGGANWSGPVTLAASSSFGGGGSTI